MGIFNKGFKAVREEKKRQDEIREKSRNRLWNFFLTEDGEEADILFLTEEPINFYVHTHPQTRNGKTFYEDTLCIGEDCEFCADGERPIFKGAFLIVDRREFEYKDKDGKKQVGKDQVRLYIQGTRVLSQLDRKSSRYGLVGREYTIVRIGKGQSTVWSFENGDKINLTSKEIENLLPDFLKEKYDGTEESLYDIVKEQVMLMTPEGFDNSDEDEDDLDEYEEKMSDKLVSVEDEEEKKPKKVGLKKKLNVSKKSIEDSRKPKIKAKLKNN